jgi:SpoVK/Ycf46/Vps4 family AAA+-type ATPase
MFTCATECIAANAERPLLTLTCADIGTDPGQIEMNLLRWFKLATNWNAIMLIDEADIYMEHRKVQDLERNNLVAGFLRAMEYYKGILFLTTNRVGTFDEAFISRINLTIYYPPFSSKARKEVWESFFSKLEREKEDKMRIHSNTRDYVEEAEELEQLQWNGREIRNGTHIPHFPCSHICLTMNSVPNRSSAGRI